MTTLAARLEIAGLSELEASTKQTLFSLCVDSLNAIRELGERSVFFVPGRIEVLGKHTDYAGGRSLLCAVERGFIVTAVPRDDNEVHVIDARLGQARKFALSPDQPVEAGGWSTYVAACIRRLSRNFPAARRGAVIAFASDLPQASGMSSSSALSTAVFFSLDAVNNIANEPAYRQVIDSREALAGYLGTIENGQGFGVLAGDQGVGTFGGSEDHTAILCCRAGRLSRYSFAPVRAEGELPFGEQLAFVLAFSGVAAAKGSGAQQRYNELSLGVRRIVEIWNESMRRSDASLAAAISSAPDAADRLRALLRDSRDNEFPPERLLERHDQFVSESTVIIPEACDALAAGDLARFGQAVRRSQDGAELMLRNQIPETISLVQSATAFGAHAASAFGAGFGGSVWALVNSEKADAFVDQWRKSYGAEFPDASSRAEFFVTRPGPGAMRL